jgi:2'-5' RNA ligase
VGDEVARLFVAVPLTEQARSDIAHLVGRAAPRGLPGRPAHPDKWHLTLRFLGDVGAVSRDRVLAELDATDPGPPFRVRWGGLGAFPNPRRATVLWVGLEEGAAQLAALAAVVEEAVEAAGFPPEDRPFRPHLTLSRIRPHQDVTALLDGCPSLGVAMPVDRVVLYRSHLGRGGARYEAIEEFPLA